MKFFLVLAGGTGAAKKDKLPGERADEALGHLPLQQVLKEP